MIALVLSVAIALAGPVAVPEGALDSDEADELFQDRRLALLVGPSSWEDPGWAQLQYADDDALSLAGVLQDPDEGHFDQVWTLTGDVSSADVRAAMDELQAASRGPDDVVFVYFSTHGTLARSDRGLQQVLVLSDTGLHDALDTGLAHDEVLDWLEALPSRRKVLLLATCHSGQGKSRLAPAVAEELASTKGGALPGLREVSEATVVIGVCAMAETAQESRDLGHDIYTWFFLQALDGIDPDGDGAVTVTEAHDHARRQTWEYTGGRQRAWARAEILGADPVVLTGERSSAGAPVLGSWRESLAGYGIRVDGLFKGELPGELVLEPGAHTVELVSLDGQRAVARQRVVFEQGARMEAADVFRHDTLRLGAGVGYMAMSPLAPSDVLGTAEVHLPSVLGRGWEIVAWGGLDARWPRPGAEGGLAVEKAVIPGPLQLRAGAGVQGFVLNSDAPMLEPSIAPVPVLSVAWLPRQPLFARLSVSGGYLWTTTDGAWEHGWHLRAGLVAGGAL